MEMKVIGAGLLLGALGVGAAQTRPYQQVEHGQIAGADGTARPYRIRRLQPAAFPQVPKAVRKELEGRKCLIPQTFASKGAENLISGEFRKKGETGWAALCSRDGYSTLLVFWNESARSVAELGRRKDMDMMQAVNASGEAGYSWSIIIVRPNEILAREGNEKAGPFDHDGIDDGFLEKGSSIHYFRDGRWLQLEGAD
jgi:hypothetical protein